MGEKHKVGIYMTPPSNFSDTLIRTGETLTAGITNIPLTKPAKVWFIVQQDKLDECVSVFRSNNILYDMKSYVNSAGMTTYHITSLQECDYSVNKMIWNNYKSLHPKFNSNWRYLFWELDAKENTDYGRKVLRLYAMLDLPVYYHETARGWHFLSVKPIPFEEWKQAVSMIRYTNPEWPAVALRVKANKYVSELEYFMKGHIQESKHHSDTNELKRLVETQNIDKLSQKYQLVWYQFSEGDR